MDPLREVAEAIVNLGIADELRLAPFIRASRDRSIGESTQDGTDDVEDFLDRLSTGGVLDAEQRRTIERILRGEKTPRAGPPPQAKDPYIGRSFGAFTAIAKIGEGGMGAVYRAEREDDGSQDYVVKVLSPLAADQATYVRFRREGEVMSALRHPNVVRVFASGEQDGLSYIVMEFVDGPTLQDLFEKKQRFDWANAARACRQILLGLEAAHAMGVIHRDVKPQNVLLAKAEGLLKVGDFGLAKIHKEPSDPAISRAGDILGSPAYIAPEQWGDHDVDPRADLFALGIILYQLVTGVLPFRGRSPSEYAKKILSIPYDPVELYAPDCPEGMRDIIARLLEKKREHRYPTAAMVVADLERVVRGELPDIPRVVRAQGAPERWPLLGRDEFVIGRGSQAQIVVNHPSVVERHATVVRTNAGITLREGEGRGQVRVNGMRVRDIALKDGDVIEIGEAPPLRYKAGAQPGSTVVPSGQSPSSGKLSKQAGKAGAVQVPPVAVPGPLYEAFLREEHPRAVLALVELLDEATHGRRVVRSEKRLLAAGIDAGAVARAAERARASYRRIAALAPDRLFRATHENLGPDPSTWLGWWFTSGSDRFPPQVLPPGPRASGMLAIFEEELGTTQTADLTGVESWTIGRGSECAIRLYDRSVSRKHATIQRLLTRFAIRDEGSRFGTAVRGERKPVALLRHDDAIELGRARLIFRQPEEAAAGADPHGIDAVLFDTLVEMRLRCVIGALVGFTDVDARAASVVAAGFVAQGDEDVAKIANGLLQERRRQALEALPPLARKDLGGDAAPWREWWKGEKASAGPQVHPEGWAIED
ncbi:MAG TPA: FHA domain-containing serine/threonine-protein kinase [Planctomycetota bacterium]|nr:FHA domain-containing serine/threonine-protein kinase [Planctomycetota bacterium]